MIKESCKAMLYVQEERKWEEAQSLRIKRLSVIDQIPDNIEDIHFIGDDAIFMYSVESLDELLTQVNQWKQYNPELLSYNLFVDGTLVCVFITSLGCKLNTYCNEVIPALEYFSKGKCVIETVMEESKHLKCMRG